MSSSKEFSEYWSPSSKTVPPVSPSPSTVDKIRSEVRMAKALLDLKSEIGRLPLTPRTQGLLDLIEDWFSSNPDQTTSVNGGE